MQKLILTYNDDKGLCPSCGNKLRSLENWDKLFDRYDINTPQVMMVIQRLFDEDEPKYKCDHCEKEVLVSPSY